MAAAVLARRVTWLRARIAKASPSAAVFSPCPWFLLILIVVLLVGEAGALSFRLPAPHTTIPPLGVLLVSLIMLVFFASISLPRNLPEWGYCVAACLILPLGNTIMPAALAEAIAFLPHVYDANVVELDGTLGVQPSFVVGALFVRFPDLAWLCAAIYAGVLLPTAILALAEGHHGQRTGLGALSTFLVIAGAGYVIYHILRVIGPVPYFGDTLFRRYIPAAVYARAPSGAAQLHAVTAYRLGADGVPDVSRHALGAPHQRPLARTHVARHAWLRRALSYRSGVCRAVCSGTAGTMRERSTMVRARAVEFRRGRRRSVLRLGTRHSWRH